MVDVNQARSLANMAFLFSQTSLSTQAYQSLSAQITGLPTQGAVNQSCTATVQVSGIDLSHATTIWEARDSQPFEGTTFTLTPTNSGPQWVEVEVMLPDGRRAFNSATFNVGTGTVLSTVNVQALNPSVSNGATGTFTLSRNGNLSVPLNLFYTMSGSAINGTNYNTLSGTFTIPAGSASANLSVVPKASSLTGGSATAVLTLTANSNYAVGSPNSAAVTITSTAPTVTIHATISGTTGSFIVSRTGSTASALTVPYAIGGTGVNGTDYNLILGSVNIPAGSSSGVITIIPKGNAATQYQTKTVVITLKPSSVYQLGSPNTATL